LGLVALAAGDTATALSEFALAVDLRGDDAALRHTYGAVLASVGKHDEATEQLRRAIELEPYYAAPYVLAGRVAEAADRPAEAVGHYQAFLARAHARDPQLGHARARVAALGTVAEAP
jgi:Tfp pilus assembly protein PilF